jgi:tetraacyldisaccharide 4'-kinase
LLASDDTADQVGDEPALLLKLTQVPVVVGHARPKAIAHLLQMHPEVNVVVSDDGMQHWAMARDLTVVVFDDRGVGNGWCLPAGLLREPWPAPPWSGSAMLVLHHGDSAHQPPSPYPLYQAWRQLSAQARNPAGLQKPLAQLQACASQPLAAVAAIGRPQCFFDMLATSGLALQRCLALPDHADGASLLQALDKHHTWLCTDKDAVKLFPLLAGRSEIEVWSVPLEQRIEPAFFEAVDRVLDKLSSGNGRQTA